MPWQRAVADVACEIDPETGLPAYREVVVTVPRQSGKTTLFLSWQIHRCLSPRWAQPQRSAFTAQSGKDARDKWIDELFPLIRHSSLKKHVARINEGMGNESVRWRNGSVIRLLSTSSSSGHSKTLHQAVLDEIWSDVDDRRQQGLRPAMLTIADAQILVCSTAGTDASVILNRKIAAGRVAVAEDSGHGTCYVEYSAPDGWDPDDEQAFYSFHPALCPNPPCECDPEGRWRHTVTLDVLRVERTGMEDDAEYARAYGNVSNSSAESWSVIPEAVYQAAEDAGAAPSGKLRLGVDCAAERESAAITSCGGGVLEVIEHREGVGWTVARAKELAKKWRATIVVDASGPARWIGEQLEAERVKVEWMTSQDVSASCGRIYDDMADGKVLIHPRVIRDTDPMRDAVKGLAKKPVGDRFVWSRLTSAADITPWTAATLAWRPAEKKPAPVAGPSVKPEAGNVFRPNGRLKI